MRINFPLLPCFQVSVPLSVKGRIVLEILEAMLYLTQRGIIHKDIKPENILVDNDFHIKVYSAFQPVALSSSAKRGAKSWSSKRLPVNPRLQTLV